MTTHRIPITALPRELAEIGDGRIPSYRQLYNLALDTKIPAELAGGRWSVCRDDLATIAVAVGLRLKVAAAPPPKRRTASPERAAA